jgi:uncharacterized protein (TIGR03435 family)
MQSLLEDRFKLVAHRETRQLPVFGLVLAKAGKTGHNSSRIPPSHRAPPHPQPLTHRCCRQR